MGYTAAIVCGVLTLMTPLSAIGFMSSIITVVYM